MKRTSDGLAVDSHHPALCFHREVLIIQQWTKVRRSFLQALETLAKDGVVQWREPRKLWRHAQEALGKWILSQVARVHLSTVSGKGDAATNAPRSPTAPLTAELHEADIRFFPTADQLRRAAAHARRQSSLPTSSSGAAVAAADDSLVTYDKQLVRDLSLKSNGKDSAAAVEAIVRFVKDFNLPQRCAEAAAAVEAAMRDVTPSQAARPRIRRIEADDPGRTVQQQRIAGPIAEVAVQWPRHWRREQCRDCPAVSLPWAAVEKLRCCYELFSEEAEHARYDRAEDSEEATAGAPQTTRQRRFELRAATVILRYEGGLATGSLQLCADTRLKQHLHAAGYHVMDLCASPINAYMGVPQVGSFDASGISSGGAFPVEEVPNYFCSAFYDTDRYFGSMGSAVAVDPLHISHTARINPAGKPLLLTLDVPYDEDLCELLFQKLVKDMHRATATQETAEERLQLSTSTLSSPSPPIRVDYVLVLPLWWDIPMKIDKRFFADGTAGSSIVSAADLQQLTQNRAAMLEEGYKVPYTWPTALAVAAGDARRGTPGAWVCFDSVFVDDRYGYFCTNTNQWLHGVTATEVIGLAQPCCSESSGAEKSLPQLQRALDAFYGRAAAASS